MPKYEVEVSKDWTEHGRVTVEAEDEQEARQIVEEMLVEDRDDIEWDSSNMDPQGESIHSVKLKSPPGGA